jgi:hypothetical protein
MLTNFRESNVKLYQIKMPDVHTDGLLQELYNVDYGVFWSSRKAPAGTDSCCLIRFVCPLINLNLLRSKLLNNGSKALMCGTLSTLRPTDLRISTRQVLDLRKIESRVRIPICPCKL